MKFQLAFLSLLVFSITSPALGESFRNPIRLATTADLDGVFVGDLNGDGKPDILWTLRGQLIGGSPTVQVFLAQDDGSFSAAPAVTLLPGVTPYCQVADETGDSKADLICPYASQSKGSLMVFPSNGDGTFGAAIETVLPSKNPGASWFPVVGRPADFNHDGIADFLVANELDASAYVMAGKGDGTFREVKQTSTNSKDVFFLYEQLNEYQAMDVNGDGHLDLLFSNGNLLLGDGTGQFKAGSQEVNAVPGSCAFGKLEGEPHIDLVCGQPNTGNLLIDGASELLIFHGNGDGTFNRHPIKTITYDDDGTLQAAIAVMDLNGDGVPDIVAEGGDGLSVLFGGPGLGFSYPAHYATGFYPDQFKMRITDLNGDGLPDLIQSGPNGIYITYGRPDGVYDTARAYELAEVIGHETIADFNGDGIPDIAVTGEQSIELSLGKGDGSFEYRKPLPRGNADFSGGGSASVYIVHGDFNGDHRQDIIAAGASCNNRYNDCILFGHGNGTFTTPVPITNSLKTFPVTSQLQVFDFNHDGKDDLFAYDSANIYVALSEGNGSFKTVTSPISPFGPPTIADLRGNGNLEAIVPDSSDLLIFSGKGDGSFSGSGRQLSIPRFDGVLVQGAVAVAVGDFDHDGHKDIALLATAGSSSQPPDNTYQTVLFVYWGNGDGTFSKGVPVIGFDRAYSNLYAADLNKDGLDDIVLVAAGPVDNGNAVGVVHALPDRTFGPEVNYYAGSGFSDVAIADLNRDGFPDLILGNGGSSGSANSATVLMNLGNAAGVTGSVYALPEPSDTTRPFEIVASLDSPDESALTGDVTFFVDGQSVGSGALAENQASISVTKSYAAGLHKLSATWPGNGQFAAVTLSGKHQVTGGYPTSTSIASEAPEATVLAPIQFIIRVQSTSGTPAGSVSLLNGTLLLATVRLSGGSATYTTTSLPAGKLTITAQYLPGKGWASSSASFLQQVDPIYSTTTLTFSPKVVYAYEPVVFKATVKQSGPIPTGTITFFRDSTNLGAEKLVKGAATVATFFAKPNTHIIKAEYSGNRDYSSGSSGLLGVVVLVNPTVTRLQASPNPAAAGQAVTLTARVTPSVATHYPPAGTVQFSDNGASIGSAKLVKGVATLKISSLAVGTHPIVASFPGENGYGASQSAPLTLVIDQANSYRILTALPAPGVGDANASLKATRKSSPRKGLDPEKW